MKHGDCLGVWNLLIRVGAGVDSNGVIIRCESPGIHCGGYRLVVQKQVDAMFALIHLLFLCIPMFCLQVLSFSFLMRASIARASGVGTGVLRSNLFT